MSILIWLGGFFLLWCAGVWLLELHEARHDLPDPDRSVKRDIEVFDEMARYRARVRKEG